MNATYSRFIKSSVFKNQWILSFDYDAVMSLTLLYIKEGVLGKNNVDNFLSSEKLGSAG